jgi:hypothetical protein
MPSGPIDVNATSPVPGAEFQPSGSGTVIVGATGSGTDALVMLPLVGGGGKHITALGGMWSGSVTSTPGTGSAGSDGLDAAEVVVDYAVCLTGKAVPPVVFPQPTATPADRQITTAVPSATHTAWADSVARKCKRNFSFDVYVRPA